MKILLVMPNYVQESNFFDKLRMKIFFNPYITLNQIATITSEKHSVEFLDEAFQQINFDENGIIAQDWDSYPILRFPDVPVIETVLINRPELPFLGSGEAAQGLTPAAIANAVFNAVGVRLRQIPFTEDRVKAALSAVSGN